MIIYSYQGKYNLKIKEKIKMVKSEYLKQLFKLYNSGEISEEAYDAGVMNADIFCDEESEETFD